jgi:hypothetical protein
MHNNLLNTSSFFLKNFPYFFRYDKTKIILKKYLENFYELKTNGVTIVKSFINEDLCDKLINVINKAIIDEKKILLTTKSLDHRLWGLENITSIAYDLLNNPDLVNLVKKYEKNKNLCESTVLGALIKYVKNGKGSGEGWHRDRTFYKYKYTKAIIYLNDVNEHNGPFQYLVGSHKIFNIMKLNHKYNIQYHVKEFSDELINEINKSNVLDIKTCAGKKGDLIIFDGTGIHRGKPLNENHRYAITHYYRFDPDEIMPFKKINNCLKK